MNNKLSILDEMDNNLKKSFVQVQSQNNVKTTEAPIITENKSNNISNLMPLLNMFNKGGNMDFQSLLKNPNLSQLFGGKQNPMLNQLISLLPNLMPKIKTVQTKKEKSEPIIDSLVKVDDYNLE